jgi:hypothetical protein
VSGVIWLYTVSRISHQDVITTPFLHALVAPTIQACCKLPGTDDFDMSRARWGSWSERLFARYEGSGIQAWFSC